MFCFSFVFPKQEQKKEQISLMLEMRSSSTDYDSDLNNNNIFGSFMFMLKEAGENFQQHSKSRCKSMWNVMVKFNQVHQGGP